MWPFKKKKIYKYGTKEFSNTHTTVNQLVHEWLRKHPDVIPVSISMCPSGISGVTFVIIIYKEAVKSE